MLIDFYHEKNTEEPVVVADACNPGYSGGWDIKTHALKKKERERETHAQGQPGQAGKTLPLNKS